MTTYRNLWATLKRASATFLLSAGVSACAAAGNSWKEEVLLHDGRSITVQRSQTYGGRSEVGQAPPIRELRLSFELPGNSKPFSWTSEYGDELGRTNFKLLALHVLGDVPYLVTVPNLCLSYNRWGRPNPPYVVFKHDRQGWNRIDLKELPPDFKTNNLTIDTLGEKTTIASHPLISAALVESLNGRLEKPEYRSILRAPINYDPDCVPMVSNGKGLWRAQAWFSGKPTLQACQTGCKSESFDEKTCPCNKFFEGK